MSNIFRQSPSGRIISDDLIKNNPIANEFWEAPQGEQHSGSASISANGSLIGSILKGGRGSALVSAAGVLLAIGVGGMLAIASISGGGSQVGIGKKSAFVEGLVSGNGSLVATGEAFEPEQHEGAGAISGNGQITSSGIKSTGITIQISTNGLLQGMGSKQGSGDSLINGLGSIYAEGYQPESHSGLGIISGNGSLETTGTKQTTGGYSIRIETGQIMMGYKFNPITLKFEPDII